VREERAGEGGNVAVSSPGSDPGCATATSLKNENSTACYSAASICLQFAIGGITSDWLYYRYCTTLLTKFSNAA